VALRALAMLAANCYVHRRPGVPLQRDLANGLLIAGRSPYASATDEARRNSASWWAGRPLPRRSVPTWTANNGRERGFTTDEVEWPPENFSPVI
jgi:hypothetical protein